MIFPKIFHSWKIFNALYPFISYLLTAIAGITNGTRIPFVAENLLYVQLAGASNLIIELLNFKTIMFMTTMIYISNRSLPYFHGISSFGFAGLFVV
jgi:hypothetical protein